MSDQKILPFLWFHDAAEEAVDFYVSLFRNSKIHHKVPGPHGKTMLIEFQLDGTRYLALNGGPQFTFNEAISLSIGCEDQKEIDFYWERLSDGGQTSQCGWLKDRYGLSWQVVYNGLSTMMADPEPKKPQQVMAALMTMTKINISELHKAYEQ